METLYEATILKKQGDWIAGVPGAIGLLAGIGFVVGIVNEGMRELLPEVLAGCLVVAILGALLYWRGSRGLMRTLRAGLGEDKKLRVELYKGEERELVLDSPSIAHGVFIDLITAGASSRRAPVTWVTVGDAEGASFTVRRAHGILDKVPGWPSARYVQQEAWLFGGDTEDLYQGLSKVMKEANIG